MSVLPRRNSLESALKMQAALQEKPQTYDSLTLVSGLNKPIVARWVKAVRALNNPFIHIAEWRDDARGRKFVPAFAWGQKPDAQRPGNARTSAERMAASRARRKLEAV